MVGIPISCCEDGQKCTRPIGPELPKLTAGVCKVLAGLLVARMYTCEDEKLDIAGCAKCSNSRISEACNPGPRRGTGPRFGVLEEVPLVDAKTLAI